MSFGRKGKTEPLWIHHNVQRFTNLLDSIEGLAILYLEYIRLGRMQLVFVIP